MASFFTFIAKYYIFFVNLLFVIVGGSFILYGSLMMNWFHKYTTFFQRHYDFIPIIIISLGVIMLLVSVLGLVASLKSHYQIMIVFASLFLILFVVEVIGVAIYFGYTKSIFQFLGKKLEFAFKQYERDIDVTLVYNRIQSGLRCCGIKGNEDFRNRLVPISCCKSVSKNKCVKNSYYKRGCLEALLKIPDDYGNVIVICLLTLIGAQFVELACAFFLVYAFRHDFETV